MKIDVQGLEHMKMPFSHASIYNNHKHKSIFMNVMIWLSIVMCISHSIECKIVSSELYLDVVHGLEHEKMLNNLCDM